MHTLRPDPARGTVRVRGHLDRVGAELLRNNLAVLQDLGHQQITVQIAPSATADPQARDVLAGLAARLAAEGVRLAVE